MLRPPRLEYYIKKNKDPIVYLPYYNNETGTTQKIKLNLQGLGQKQVDDLFKFSESDNQENYKNMLDERKIKENGLFDYEIEEIVKKLNFPKGSWKGIYNIDTIKNVRFVKGKQKQGFIFNTDKSSGEGEHWIAVLYDPVRQSLEYYDSVAREPTDEFRKQIKVVIDRLDLPYQLKFKVNQIARQGWSSNCGFHAIKFLYDRIVDDKDYKFATGYNDIKQGEDYIKKFKQNLRNKFDYI